MTYTVGKYGPVHAESVTDEIILEGFKNLAEAMAEGFDRIDRKIDDVDRKVNRRIADLEHRMMRRFDAIDERLDGHERRITALETHH